ncbi:hypothetical protein [Thalassococcus sp. S3]|uniref:hypothetical protein n=1 Tax=Thalassococcus sp. S3 TaxID=2017482 RepID=UPI00102414FF|nr:hypothetical protein [Thalassococcus sp. S3]QBF32984.1 hypothetical protein CFI11_17405 [Thalassococcus sp. S3]
MVLDHLHFNKRLRQLARKHQAMSNGYSPRMRADGLIVFRPKRKRSGVSLPSLVLFVFAFFAFKAFLVASLGDVAYEDRLATLKDGTFVEQGGAWVMQVDPATRYLADHIGPILR